MNKAIISVMILICFAAMTFFGVGLSRDIAKKDAEAAAPKVGEPVPGTATLGSIDDPLILTHSLPGTTTAELNFDGELYNSVCALCDKPVLVEKAFPLRAGRWWSELAYTISHTIHVCNGCYEGKQNIKDGFKAVVTEIRKSNTHLIEKHKAERNKKERDEVTKKLEELKKRLTELESE
jgi:hypothetical protein